MKNIIIPGASGNIAKHVIELLIQKEDIYLTLFLRNKCRIRNKNSTNYRIVEGNVFDYPLLKEAIAGQDIVYVNLAGDYYNLSVWGREYYFSKEALIF